MEFKSLKGNDSSKYRNLMIVDSLNLAFRYKHISKRNFKTDYLRTIQSFAKSYEASRVIITGDAGSAWRKEIYPEYKANRATLKENQTEAEQKEWQLFFDDVAATLELLNTQYTVLRYPGVEADDLMAYICKMQEEEYDHTWLISTDKDIDLLISDKISRFSYITRKETTMQNFEEHYEYPPSWHLGIKVLMGDKGDNIFGVSGVGIKRAYALLKQYDGDIFDLIDDLPIVGKYVYIKNLNTFGVDKLHTNIEIMDLLTYCEEAIGYENIEDINEQL